MGRLVLPEHYRTRLLPLEEPVRTHGETKSINTRQNLVGALQCRQTTHQVYAGQSNVRRFSKAAERHLLCNVIHLMYGEIPVWRHQREESHGGQKPDAASEMGAGKLSGDRSFLRMPELCLCLGSESRLPWSELGEPGGAADGTRGNP